METVQGRKRHGARKLRCRRRDVCLSLATAPVFSASLLNPRRRAAGTLPELRLGTVQFGTLQWVATTIERHELDRSNGFKLAASVLADTGADRVALLANAVDIMLSDWIFAAAQRAAGNKICFAPFSSALGGVMVPSASPIHELRDLTGHRLGVAGGPNDKSWLIVQATARRDGVDLGGAQIDYGAPPLLDAKLRQGELHAVLTFWNFAARLEASGYHQAVSVPACLEQLGIPRHISLVGFVFREDWALRTRPTTDGFLRAVRQATQLLAESEEEWRPIRSLMNAPDEAAYASLRGRFLEGTELLPTARQSAAAARLLQIMQEVGGTSATAGLTALPPGTFWQEVDASL